jgi:dihydrofolate reductase
VNGDRDLAARGRGGAADPDASDRPSLSSIWAQDRTRVLGSGHGMLWHVPADYRHFRSSTVGCPVVMGRASWESLGDALPDRANIVITRTPGYSAPGALVVGSLEEAIDEGVSAARRDCAPTVWVTGGGRVYAEAMSVVDELVVTDLDLDVVAGGWGGPVVRAPRIDPELWAVDEARSDGDWRPVSGDARWRVTTWIRRR